MRFDEPIRILLVDDDQGDYEMTRAMLEEIQGVQVELDWLSSFDEGLAALEQDEHDVYLLDYFLEDRDGLALLRAAVERRIRAPVIMLTGRGSREVDLEAMRAGAADYLVKGEIDPDRLERSIRYALARARTQEALRESEERHRSMFDHLPVGVYRATPEGELLEANPALIRMLGYPDRQTLRRVYSHELYVNPEDRDRFWGVLDEYGVIRGFETELRKLDGTSIRVRNTARVHHDEQGEILYVEGALEDVTDLQVADEVRAGEARFRAIFDQVRIGIAVLDLDGLIQEVNPALEEIFALTGEDLEGIPAADLVVEDDHDAMQRDLAAVSGGEAGSRSAERRFVRGDGRAVWGRAVISAVRGAGDLPGHLLLLLEDVAETSERDPG